jgi:hypothetical protein
MIQRDHHVKSTRLKEATYLLRLQRGNCLFLDSPRFCEDMADLIQKVFIWPFPLISISPRACTLKPF